VTTSFFKGSIQRGGNRERVQDDMAFARKKTPQWGRVGIGKIFSKKKKKKREWSQGDLSKIREKYQEKCVVEMDERGMNSYKVLGST